MLALVEQYYGGWKRGYVAPQVPAEPEQTAERRVDVTYDGQTLPIVGRATRCRRSTPRDRTRVAADLLAELAFGETSEALRAARARRAGGRVLGRGRRREPRPGLLDVIARVKDPAKVDYVLGVIDATIAD